MASARQERLTPGATFIDASGRTRWRSRVPGVPDVEADVGEEVEPDASLPALNSLRNAFSEEGTDSSAGVSSALARPSKAAQVRSANMNETARRTLEAETETFPEIRPVFLSPSLATMPWASETDEQESTAARVAGKPEDQLRRERFLQAYQNTYGLVPPVGHPSLDGVEALRSADVASPITTTSTPVRADSPGVVSGTAPSTTPKPVTVASVPVKTSNIPTAIPTASSVSTKAIAPTTSTSPAGRPDSAGVPNLPTPSSEGAGGDSSERDLYLARLAAQNAAGFGSMGAGKNIDMGIADTLGERLKQVQALRAKKEEQSLEQQRERSTWGASNRATLASALAQWKSDGAKTAALEALASGADTTKPSDFSRNAVNAVMTKPKVLGVEAGVAKTEAGTTRTLGSAATDAALRPNKVAKLEADTKLSRARNAKIYKDMQIAGAKLALDERRTIEQAQQSKDPSKKLESLNTIADKKEFGGFTTLAGDLGDLERVAPGFVTRGEVPGWLTREQQALGQNWPTSTDPRVVDFLATYGKVANEERHRQYGSAQTDGELRTFMQQLNANPLSAGPQVLATQVKRFGQAVGRVAKGRLTRYNNVFGAENVDTVFASEWKPLFDAGGVFAGQGTPFVATRAPAAAGGAPETATVTIKRKTDDKTKTVPAVDRARWLANPDFEEVK